jgi:hypothetical protein
MGEVSAGPLFRRPPHAAWRAPRQPRTIHPAPQDRVLTLQRTAGNRAVSTLLQGSGTSGPASASARLPSEPPDPGTRETLQTRPGHGLDREQVRGDDASTAGQSPAFLAVSSPMDPRERAAQRIADELMDHPDHGTSGVAPQAGLGRPSRQPTVEMPASVTQILSASGRPLDDDRRHDMERRLGHNFSAVRIHDDELADRSAREMASEAFTVGHDLVFRAGRYAPDTREGQRLLAHELSHTIGQAASPTVWLDRQPDVHRAPVGQDKTVFPYTAKPSVDEVALRASPAGRKSGAPFHNLVASLRQDVSLVVEGSTGGWMRVRVTSGTALDGRTNKPVNAAGLTGYVSAELLAKQATPVPKPRPWPPIDPAAYTSLEKFSEDWPDRVTSTEAIEQVWLGQSKQDWTGKALAAAGIKPGEWRPGAGFRKSQQTFEKVYRYYASLYLADNRLKWAAMAKLAGGEVYRGFRDQIVPNEKFGEFLSGLNDQKDTISVTDVLGTGYELYAGSIDIILLQMQQAIFMDLAWQHEAYREGGIKALAAARKRGELTEDLFAAWQDIDSGESGRVNAGNMALLKREQFNVLQGAGTGGYYGKIQDIPDNDVIPETMSEEAQSPIPGGKSFADVVPGGDITKFDDRWKWLEKDMIPAFEKLDPTTLQNLVQKPLGELADRKF